jgi:hypothetical protein
MFLWNPDANPGLLWDLLFIALTFFHLGWKLRKIYCSKDAAWIMYDTVRHFLFSLKENGKLTTWDAPVLKYKLHMSSVFREYDINCKPCHSYMLFPCPNHMYEKFYFRSFFSAEQKFTFLSNVTWMCSLCTDVIFSQSFEWSSIKSVVNV